jgi:hypothetical protein
MFLAMIKSNMIFVFISRMTIEIHGKSSIVIGHIVRIIGKVIGYGFWS